MYSDVTKFSCFFDQSIFSTLTSSDVSAKQSLLSCKANCAKILTCGHQCSLPCHYGPCIDAKDCLRKIIIRCPCKRLKKVSLVRTYPRVCISSVQLKNEPDTIETIQVV